MGPESLASQQQYLQPLLETESHKWMVTHTHTPLMSMIWYCWHPQSIWHINLIFRLYLKLSQVRKRKLCIPPLPEYKPAFQNSVHSRLRRAARQRWFPGQPLFLPPHALAWLSCCLDVTLTTPCTDSSLSQEKQLFSWR